MSENIKVSVILPSLNVADYIDDAVSSVRNQTLRDIEIICVDAESTDGTRDVIEKHAREDDRIIVIDCPVKSYGYQVNRGIEITRGEYVAIMETDDYVDLDMYRSLYEAAVNEKLDYVKCNYDIYSVDDQRNIVISTRNVSRESYLYENVFTPSDHTNIAFEDWYLWNGIYKVDFLRRNEIGFFETRGAAFQDIGFLHKTTSTASSAKYVDQSYYRYCVNRSDASSKSDRTIFFIRQEYGLLLNEIGDAGTVDQWRLLYKRMAKSFVRTCMDCSTDLLKEVEVSYILRWFQKRLAYAEDRGYITSEELPEGLRETYKHLINPALGYLSYRKVRRYELNDFLGVGHPIIIFGCGMYGREALGYIRNLGGNVQCFMDNCERLWGTYVEGIMVENPKEIEAMNNDTRYVVANENYPNEIAAQIKSISNQSLIYIF